MAIEIGLRTLLLAESTVTALAPAQTIGGISFDAIFNENPVQGFLCPFVLVSQISHDPWKHLGTTTGISSTEFDIDCYARTYPAAKALAAAVSLYLKDYVGVAGASDTIDAVLWENETFSAIYDDDGRDVRQYIVSLNFDIQHH